MARLQSLLWFTVISCTTVVAALSSCTVDDGDDDTDAGSGGDMTTDGGKPAGGTTGGTTPSGGGGASGGGISAGAGGVPPSEGGAGGAPPSGKVCQGAAGEGQGGAEGKTCADYCSDYFDHCETFADDAGFNDEGACRLTCENFSEEQLCCRAFHVSLAGEGGAGSAVNCREASGDGPDCN